MTKQRVRQAAWALALMSMSSFACAQYIPAGMQGTWKIHKLLNGDKGRYAGSCTGTDAGTQPMAATELLKTTVSLGEHSASWGPTKVQDAQPVMSTMSVSDFLAKYGDHVTQRELGVEAATLQVLTLESPGSLPFATALVKDPSTLIFERCGLFYDAVRSTSVPAP